MNALANCPGCGFRGRLPDAHAGMKTTVCPNCKIAVPVEQLRREQEEFERGRGEARGV